MKKRIVLAYTVILITVLFTFSACDSIDFGDVNTDDDVPKEANTEALMAGAMNSFSQLYGEILPTLYVQYRAQSVYTSAQRYAVSPNSWRNFYVLPLSNLKRIVEINSADEISDVTRSYGAPVNQIGVAELTSAMIWKRLTDRYGPVPYTEALKQSENLTPAYTDQEKIYKDLISRVKAARDMLDPSQKGPTGDGFYGGDVMKWKKFANSFLMSLSMQLTKKYPSPSGYAAQEFKAALNHSAGTIDELSEEMWYLHQNKPGMENPFSQYRGADYYLAEPFTDALHGTTPNDSAIAYSNSRYDARINVLSNDPSATGVPYGTDNEGVSGPSMSKASSDPASPLPYMTAAYTYLNRAEAAQLGWTSESVDQMLTEGIMMSYATFDEHFDDGSASSGDLQKDGSQFAAQRIADANDPGYNYLQIIGEEKWVSLFPNGMMAWSEWRRTGYPGLVPAPDATNNGEIPRRYIYPADESGINGENYQNALNMLTPQEDNNTSRFWWDKQ